MDQAVNTERKDGDYLLRLQGRLDRTRVAPWWQEITGVLRDTPPERVVLDFKDATGIDTAGVAFILTLENLCASQGIKLTTRNLTETVRPFLRYMREHFSGRRIAWEKPRADVLSRLGEWVLKNLRDSRHFIKFFGDFLVASPRQLILWRRLHLGETLYQIQLAGVGAVPLLVTLSLLLGALMVFQGMNSVRNFGNEVYIADLVVISVTREMAPLLTAVIMAGRSGAAFAAEIGTMKLNEEIDALTVLNFDITTMLVLPRAFAMMLAGPILTMISDAAGILGGLATALVVMGVPVASFLHEAQTVLGASDIYTGLIKGAVFGTFIGLIGCFRGLTTGMGPGSVGIQTTSAVVTGIFVVILLDTIFSYIFQMYGW